MAPPSTRPTTPTAWATNAGTRDPDPLPAGLMATGWVPGTTLPALGANTLWGGLSDWAVYLAASTPTAGVWDVTDVNVWAAGTQYGDLTTATVSGNTMTILRSTAAAAGLAIGCLGGDRTTLLLDATTDTATMFDIDTSLNHWSSTAAGGFIGPRASADGTTGIRYGYPAADPVELTYDVQPRFGGWVPFEADPTDVYWSIIAPNNYYGPVDASGAGQSAVSIFRGLGDLFPANVEHSASTVTITELTGYVEHLGGTQDVTVTLFRVDHAAPGTLTATAVTFTRTSTGTGTWTGSYTLSPGLYDYFLRIQVEDVAASSPGSGVRQLKMTVTKTAVE